MGHALRPKGRQAGKAGRYKSLGHVDLEKRKGIGPLIPCPIKEGQKHSSPPPLLNKGTLLQLSSLHFS